MYLIQPTLQNKTFVCCVNDLTAGPLTTEKPRVLLRNPVDSGHVMKIYMITTGTNVSSYNNIFRFYTSPVITDVGTPLTSVSLNINGSDTASHMQVSTIPVVESNGNLMLNICQGSTSTDTFHFPYMVALWPGQSILVNVRPNNTASYFSMNIFWIED